MSRVSSGNYTSPVQAYYQTADTDQYSRNDSYTAFLQCLDVHTHRTGSGLGAGRVTSTAIAATGNTGECQVITGGLKITDGVTQQQLLDCLQNGYTAYTCLGLTGATAASRYVGATTDGAPVSGTFAVGDWVIDQAMRIWICNSAGTSGTWGCVGSRELVAATATASQTVNSTATPGTDLTGLTTGAITPNGVQPVYIDLFLPRITTANPPVTFTVAIQKDGAVVQTAVVNAANGASTAHTGPLTMRFRDAAPTNAAHTYKVSAWSNAVQALIFQGNASATEIATLTATQVAT